MQFDLEIMRKGVAMTKLSRGGKMHPTKVYLKLVDNKDTSRFVVLWESESFWKSSVDCQGKN